MGLTVDPTARQKAIAEAIRRVLVELFNRPAWDAARVPDELARAADEARDGFEKEQANARS